MKLRLEDGSVCLVVFLTHVLHSCRQTFCGKNALDDLAVGALVSRSKELTAAPEVKEQDCQGLAEPKPKSDDRSAQPQPPSEHSEKQATTTQYSKFFCYAASVCLQHRTLGPISMDCRVYMRVYSTNKDAQVSVHSTLYGPLYGLQGDYAFSR